MLDIAKDILKIKMKVKNKQLTQSELQKVSSDANMLINALIEYSQRKELVSAQKRVLQILHEGKRGELVLTDSGVFFIENNIRKINEGKFINSDKKELEEAIAKTKDVTQFKFSSSILETLKKELGEFELVF